MGLLYIDGKGIQWRIRGYTWFGCVCRGCGGRIVEVDEGSDFSRLLRLGACEQRVVSRTDERTSDDVSFLSCAVCVKVFVWAFWDRNQSK